MKRLSVGIAGLILAMSVQIVASAATVSFIGQITEKTLGTAGSGVFGGGAAPSTLSPFVTIAGAFSVVDGGTSSAITPIGSGLLSNSAGATITITGGTLNLVGTNTTDSLNVTLNLGGDMLGNLVFSINADVVGLGATINQANLNAFAFIPSSSAVLTDLANGGAQYSGSVTAVPEPSSLACLGLLTGVVCWRRRRSET
ncbi:MAG: hypothetical protein KatS3mg111_0251 [Pirellulaceae bacterium]|nr:MAG: hypothetical protein KatS3mg111_0251 [Pirellulaceae bacterium]